MKPNVIFLTLLLTAALLAPARQVSAGPAYKVGVVPQYEIRRLRRIWQPILNHLEAATGEKLELMGSPTIQMFEAELMDGEFDFAYMNPYHLIMAHRESGYLPLVRDVGHKLFGVLVVRKSGPVHEVGDLEGKIIAFPSPNALGASLQMHHELTDIFGLHFSSRYVKTHDSVYLNVLLGEAAAGGGVQRTLDLQKKEIRNSLRVIHTTTPVPAHPFAVHPRVPPGVAKKVKAALLELGTTESGREMLLKIPIRKIGPADISDYRILETMGLERFYVNPQ